MSSSKVEGLDWSLLSRALMNHDASTAYTLLSEQYSPPTAGLALLKLIETVPDWPKADLEMDIDFETLLTPREMQTLRCAERGLSVMDTAKELILSVQTVKSYRSDLFLKLDVASISEAIHRARDLGLIT